MKRILCLAVALALLLAGCGAQPAPEEPTAGTAIETETQPQTEEPQEEWAVLTPPSSVTFLYDPATGTTFPPQPT